jgi:hypothetical protein
MVGWNFGLGFRGVPTKQVESYHCNALWVNSIRKPWLTFRAESLKSRTELALQYYKAVTFDIDVADLPTPVHFQNSSLASNMEGGYLLMEGPCLLG